MKRYLVGGACRDIIMRVEPKDYDYVVIDSTPEDMVNLGFRKVGSGFPVFLHPENNNEYALARIERKSGTGCSGFTCEWKGVTLEEDLARRDLTINSIAWDCWCDFGRIYDPFNGRADINDKTLRHTTEAFSEDPLRVLRVARFMARFGDEWVIAPETKKLMDSIYHSGELLSLTPERVWKETEKALGEKYPSLYFSTLKRYDHLFIEINDGYRTPQIIQHRPEFDVGTHQELVIDYAATTFKDKEVTFACAMHDLGKSYCWMKYGNAFGHEIEGLLLLHNFCDKWKVPNIYRELAVLTCEFHSKVHGCMGRGKNGWMRPKSVMKLFEDTGALRTPTRFLKLLMACESDARGRGLDSHEDYTKTKDYFLNKPYPQRKYLEDCLESVTKLQTSIISQKLLSEAKTGVMIGQAIRQERIKLIREVQNKWKQKV